MVLRFAIVGTGITATAHARALAGLGQAALPVSVGIGPEAAAFGARFGCSIVPTLEEALPLVDAVIVATPSALHAPMTFKALSARRHVLVEAPMAMSLADGEDLVRIARERDLVLAVSHPLRLRPPLRALAARIADGTERLLTANAVFYMASPRAPVGVRSASWTDNVLWHHMSHGADLIHWLVGGRGLAVTGGMAPADSATGIPMRAWAAVDLPDGFALVSADYAGVDRNELLLVTDRDTYHFDQVRATFADRSGVTALSPPRVHLEAVARDFAGALLGGTAPAVPGESVLPQLRMLQSVQDGWDRLHGTVDLPGRTIGCGSAGASSGSPVDLPRPNRGR